MLHSENEANHEAANGSDSSDEAKESIKVETKRSSAEGPDVLSTRYEHTTIRTYPRKPLRETATVDNIKAFILGRSKSFQSSHFLKIPDMNVGHLPNLSDIQPKM